jgi:hypothetical protein
MKSLRQIVDQTKADMLYELYMVYCMYLSWPIEYFVIFCNA